MAGRIFAGLGQITVAVTGLALVITWFVLTMIQTYNQITSDAPARSFGGLGGAGALVFAAAWLWSLVTSLSLLREAKTAGQAAQQTAPPKITGETSLK